MPGEDGFSGGVVSAAVLLPVVEWLPELELLLAFEGAGAAAGAAGAGEWVGAGAGAGVELPWLQAAPANRQSPPTSIPTRIEPPLRSAFIVSLPEFGEPATDSPRLKQLRTGYGWPVRYVDIGSGANGLSARSH